MIKFTRKIRIDHTKGSTITAKDASPSRLPTDDVKHEAYQGGADRYGGGEVRGRTPPVGAWTHVADTNDIAITGRGHLVNLSKKTSSTKIVLRIGKDTSEFAKKEVHRNRTTPSCRVLTQVRLVIVRKGRGCLWFNPPITLFIPSPFSCTLCARATPQLYCGFAYRCDHGSLRIERVGKLGLS